MRELLEAFTAYAVRLLGSRLKGVVIFGSAARPQDFTPVSDINVAVFVEGEVSAFEKVALSTAFGSQFFPLVLRVEDLEELLGEGHMLAHAIVKDSRIIVCDDDVKYALATDPPVTRLTLDCLYKRSLACLSAAVRSYYQGLEGDSVAYAYRALKTAVAYRKAVEEEGLVFSDQEALSYLDTEFKELGSIMRMLISSRRMGRWAFEEDFDRVVEAVASLLGLSPTTWSSVVKEIFEMGAVVLEDVKVRDEDGVMRWEVWFTDRGGRRVPYKSRKIYPIDGDG